MDGVVAYLDHKDVPGLNSIVPGKNWYWPYNEPEEIFSSGKVKFAGQTVGLILAKTPDTALQAAKLVKVKTMNKAKPVLTIKEALKDPNRIEVVGVRSIDGDANPEIFVEGEWSLGSQYHFYMETQSVLIRPSENGEFDVYAGTQWLDATNRQVNLVLNKPMNKINVVCRRLGGGFGGKMKNSLLVASAAAVAANKMKTGVKIVMDLQSNMATLGKRDPHLIQYKVGVTKDGLLQSIDATLSSDVGFSSAESSSPATFSSFQNAYNCPNWKVKYQSVITDLPANTFVRAPGSTQGHNAIECILDHVAYELQMDPVELRLKNFFKKGDILLPQTIPGIDNYFMEDNPLPGILDRLKKDSDFEARLKAVEDFNKVIQS